MTTRDSVPIPAPIAEPPAQPGRKRRRNSGVVRSSLDLVFSYSRSQQKFFAGLPSAPSFVDYQWGDGAESDFEEGDESMREWDPEAGPSHTACDSCDEAGQESEALADETPDTSAFFPDDHERRGAAADDETPLTAPRPLTESVALPVKRGGIMSFFSTTPTAHSVVANLGTSVTSGNSGGSDTPRAAPRRLPDEAPLSRSWANQQQRALGLTAINPNQSPKQQDRQLNGGATGTAGATERTPLLRPGRTTSIQRSWTAHDRLSPSPHRRLSVSHRRLSASSARRRMSTAPAVGESGNGQTLFNAVAVLVGVGLLSMPLAFSYAGWIGGTIMLLGFSYLTCHTAKLLARIVFADPSLQGYTDIGRKAFGSWVGGITNALFCVELFAFGVAMIVLFGDSVHTLFPEVSEDTCKAFGFLLVLPTVFMPLNLLSVPSVFSSLATVLLVLIILFDGFWKTQAPGSILDPMPTSLGPELNHMNWLGGIGLILAGFGGHGVMPSIARDMKHPEAVDRIFNMAFTVAAAISMLAGGAGYLMMGDKVSDEITRDMMKPKYGYPKVLNYIAIWMIIVTPLTKFGLCTRPLHIAIEGFLNLAPAAGVVAPPPPPQRQRAMSISQAISSSISQTLSHVATSDYAITDESGFDMPKTPVEPTIMEVDPVKESSKGVLRMVSRTILTAACVIAAIVLPGFEKVMAFLGSFSAFLICIILPIIFYLRLGPKITMEHDGAAAFVASQLQHTFHIVTLIISVILMSLGTVWAFLPTSGRVHGDL